MNIFVLSKNPETAAKHACDQHVVKMITETAQILCTAFENGVAPYKRTHYNHPCCKWARASFENFEWLYLHGVALSKEYTHRFGKTHRAEAIIRWCWRNRSFLHFERMKMTPFVQCMPEAYQVSDNPVQAYRKFYNHDKSSFARWKNGRKPPYWYKKLS